MTADEVTVGVVGTGLDHLGIDGRTLLDDGGTRGIALHVAGEGLAEEERVLAILLAVQILGEREDLVGRVLVHRQLGRRADDDLREGGVADEDGEQAHQDVAGQAGIEVLPIEDDADKDSAEQDAEQPAVADEGHAAKDDACSKQRTQGAVGGGGLIGLPDAKGQQGQDEEEIEDGAGVEREAQHIDGKEFDLACQLDEAGDHAIEDEGDDEHREQECTEGALEFGIGLLLEVIDQHDGGDAEQVEEVHTDGEADDVGQQDDITVTLDARTAALPFEDEPEDESRHERREGIDLGLDSREPERVGPRIDQGTHHAGEEDGDGLGPGHVVQRLVVAADDLAGKRGDGPEEEENGTSREEGRHAVDPKAGLRHVAACEVNEETSGEIEESISGRVTHLALGGAGDELRTVPEGGSGLHRVEVGEGCHHEGDPSEDVVKQLVLLDHDSLMIG